MHIYSFEKLEVWQEARVFSVYIYQITAKFPPEEKFGLVSQLRRATISIASNIAEGSARKSSKDQANFYQLAYSSTLEVLNQLIISLDLGFITEDDLLTCRNKIELISNKLNSLRKSILNT
jgi:four helix bundle protein